MVAITSEGGNEKIIIESLADSVWGLKKMINKHNFVVREILEAEVHSEVLECDIKIRIFLMNFHILLLKIFRR